MADKKITLLSDVLLPVEGSREVEQIKAGESITVDAAVAERLIRIGAAE